MPSPPLFYAIPTDVFENIIKEPFISLSQASNSFPQIYAAKSRIYFVVKNGLILPLFPFVKKLHALFISDKRIKKMTSIRDHYA
jgi:hypothetical protein